MTGFACVTFHQLSSVLVSVSMENSPLTNGAMSVRANVYRFLFRFSRIIDLRFRRVGLSEVLLVGKSLQLPFVLSGFAHMTKPFVRSYNQSSDASRDFSPIGTKANGALFLPGEEQVDPKCVYFYVMPMFLDCI